MHTFQSPEEVHKVGQLYSQHFNYYRVKNGMQIKSDKQAYYGYPIPLEHKRGRRKLVLSFFADGLAQEVINGDDFEKLMPNTYKFFSKGTICTQAHSCSEWTYPSLATCVSGLDTLHHMMFHDKLDGELPKNSPTLIEYFKGKGYYTSKGTPHATTATYIKDSFQKYGISTSVKKNVAYSGTIVNAINAYKPIYLTVTGHSYYGTHAVAAYAYTQLVSEKTGSAKIFVKIADGFEKTGRYLCADILSSENMYVITIGNLS